jgi:hypothetical protein
VTPGAGWTTPESDRRRRRRYFAIMVPCVLLIVVAWAVVARFSAPAAIAMSVVAMALPPVAAIVANNDR